MTEPQQPKAAPTNNQTTDQAIDEILKDPWTVYYNKGLADDYYIAQSEANEVRKAETRARIDEIYRWFDKQYADKGSEKMSVGHTMKEVSKRLAQLQGEITK